MIAHAGWRWIIELNCGANILLFVTKGGNNTRYNWASTSQRRTKQETQNPQVFRKNELNARGQYVVKFCKKHFGKTFLIVIEVMWDGRKRW